MDIHLSHDYVNKLCCTFCNYNTCLKKDFIKHLSTAKHKKRTNDYNSGDLSQNKIFTCTCGKIYKYRQGLCKHKKICLANEIVPVQEDLKVLVIKLMTENNDIKNVLIKENNEIKKTLIKENEELRKQLQKQSDQITEMIPKLGNNNINNTIKQRFNINVFLNEQCKDAINMNDFVKSIQVSLDQLDFTKNKGLANGLSNVILENINKLSVYERPLHCTDTKREILYIKDENMWEKDDKKVKIKKAINDVSTKQYKALRQWTQENPDYIKDDLKQDYFARTLSVIGKSTNTIDEKVIKNLCNDIYVKEN